MSDPTTNTLTLVVDNIVLGERDAELLAAIKVRPGRDEPTVSVLAYCGDEDDDDSRGVAMFLTREQALLLGQFLMLAGHIKEPS